MKTVYLVKEWNERRGTTEDAPAYYSGTGCYMIHDLKDVDPGRCYQTRLRAERYKEKRDGEAYVYGYRCKVIELGGGD